MEMISECSLQTTVMTSNTIVSGHRRFDLEAIFDDLCGRLKHQVQNGVKTSSELRSKLGELRPNCD
jgi:hypothetical protein